MGLDINTPKGQISLTQEKIMLNHIEECWGVQIVETNKKDSALVDGIILKNNEIVGICENKCRNMTYDTLVNSYGSWLITYSKLEIGQIASKIFKVPFIGFLYLVDDDITLFWKITDNEGNFLFEFKTEETPTQATINGGSAIRLNAYLPVEFSKKVEVRKKKIKK
ncbi:MAG: hypothetical protein ACOC22_02320 [bacterium]